MAHREQGRGNREQEDSAYSAAPREKADPSTNYQLTNYQSKGKPNEKAINRDYNRGDDERVL